MADVLTYDSTPDAEVMSSIESDEAESLAIGEALINEQESLLAGKYKSAQDLEKAYIELQRKLGKGSDDEDQEEVEYEASEESDEEIEEEEYDEDVHVNLIRDINQEFAENGQLSEETLTALSELNGADVAQAYIRSEVYKPQKVSLAPETINAIHASVGGEEAYQQLVGWAADNFTPDEVNAFDDVMDSGDTRAINFAIEALYYRYTNAMGYEGETIQGKPARSSDVFRSQAELVRAMSDPRYDRDPAYRQDVIAKLERSDIDF